MNSRFTMELRKNTFSLNNQPIYVAEGVCFQSWSLSSQKNLKWAVRLNYDVKIKNIFLQVEQLSSRNFSVLLALLWKTLFERLLCLQIIVCLPLNQALHRIDFGNIESVATVKILDKDLFFVPRKNSEVNWAKPIKYILLTLSVYKLTLRQKGKPF